MKGYIDLYLLPVPKKNLVKYRTLAKRYAALMCEHGAFDYREFAGEDLPAKQTLPFKKVMLLKPSELLVTAVATFKSRTHRDQVMKKMFKDVRVEAMMKEKPLMDMAKMTFGGFEAII